MPSAFYQAGGLARGVLCNADGPRGDPSIPPQYVGTLASTIIERVMFFLCFGLPNGL